MYLYAHGQHRLSQRRSGKRLAPASLCRAQHARPLLVASWTIPTPLTRYINSIVIWTEAMDNYANERIKHEMTYILVHTKIAYSSFQFYCRWSTHFNTHPSWWNTQSWLWRSAPAHTPAPLTWTQRSVSQGFSSAQTAPSAQLFQVYT